MKKRVLLLRPPHQMAETLKQVASFGFEGVAAPVLEIVPCAFQIPPLFAAEGIILSSANGVDAYFSQVDALQSPPIIAVGIKTAQKAQALGGNVVYIATQFSAKTLSKELQNLPFKNLLWIRGKYAAFPLKNTLAEVGIKVEEVVAYEQRQKVWTPEIKASVSIGVDYIFLSSILSTQYLLTELAEIPPLLPAPQWIAIGPETAHFAQKQGCEIALCAPQATFEAMLQGIFILENPNSP